MKNNSENSLGLMKNPIASQNLELTDNQLSIDNQLSLIDIIVSKTGGGKSVLLNTLNYSFCTQDDPLELPWLSVLDIGPSSFGLIELIKESLPNDKKYLAQHHRLRMEPRYSINVFDLPLGMSAPCPVHKSFLVNFLSLLATEINSNGPIDGISEIAGACIDACYQQLKQCNSPKIYQSFANPEIDSVIQNLSIELNQKTSWWEVRDVLFTNGYTHLATIAQRFAVPLLSDVASMAKRSISAADEGVIDFCFRHWIDAIAAYPILTEPTKLDVDDAKVISLDLEGVCPFGGAEADRQTAVMYMLGRHIVGSRFFLTDDDISFSDDMYKSWHTDKIESMRGQRKRMCYEAAHRIMNPSSYSVAAQIAEDAVTISKESRKLNLSLGICTQSIDHFPKIIVEMATAIYILGSWTQNAAEKISNLIGLGDTATQEIIRMKNPDKGCANFIGAFKDGELFLVRSLINTIGVQALWAFDTTTENVIIRSCLYRQIGVKSTLLILEKTYPDGVKEEVEKRKSISLNNDDSPTDICKKITDEIVFKFKEM